jgi:DNA-binding NarL/FixJ family response regulator
VTLSPARVLLADDHAVVRHGLRLVIEAEPDLTVVAEAGDGPTAVQRAAAGDVDLAILDVSMPGASGIEVAAQLAEARPQLRTLMLSMHGHPSLLYEALRAGASGYVLKSSADRDLVSACRAALRDEPFLYPEGLEAIMRGYAGDDTGTVGPALTPREREIVVLIADARTTNQIALELGISPRTVERHRENILAKLGMRDRVELTRYAILGPDRALSRAYGEHSP